MDAMFSVEDVKVMAEAIVEEALTYEDSDNGNWGNTCNFCYSGHFHDGPIKHSPNCPYLVAKDVLTGLGELLAKNKELAITVAQHRQAKSQ